MINLREGFPIHLLLDKIHVLSSKNGFSLSHWYNLSSLKPRQRKKKRKEKKIVAWKVKNVPLWPNNLTLSFIP